MASDLDIFSFGHLTLFTITQVFPGNLLEPTYIDPNNPEHLIACSKDEHCERYYFEQLEREQHCCTQLIKDCLHNTPLRWPTAEQLVATLEGMRANIEGPCGAVARADAVRQVVMMKEFMGNKSYMLIIEIEDRIGGGIPDMERRHQLQIQQKDAEYQQIVTEMQEHLQVMEQNARAELRQKDADISRLEGQLARCQIQQNGAELSASTRIQAPQVPLSELRNPLHIEWQYAKDMPYGMKYYPEAVVVKEKVYVGAGNTFNGLNVTSTVMVYNISNDEWSLLPVYDYYWFGMTSLDNKLVLIGGVAKGTEDRTNTLGVWDDKWVDTMLPPMPTARSGPTVVTYKNRWLVVAGGYRGFYDAAVLSTVEILDTRIGYWYCASPLPEPQYKMSSTLIGNMWYLLGGYPNSGQQTLCICVCIDDLTYQAVFQPVSTPESLWRYLSDTLAAKCTALSFNGALLAVGGVNCPFISLYQPSTNSWVRIGELSSARHACACTVLPNGRLFILGGNTTIRMPAQATIKYSGNWYCTE